MRLLKNWKTTLAGIIALLMFAKKIVNAEPISADDYAVLATGLGLLSAKDYNVSHTQQ